MAVSLGGNVLQTTFAALSFAGAGYLFQHLNSSGYTKEMRRHNKALEDLAAAKELFYENEVKHKDKTQRLRQELSDANADIQGTNKALDELKSIRNIQFKGQTFHKHPELNDFYKPSCEMEEYQMLVSGGMVIGLGYLSFYLT